MNILESLPYEEPEEKELNELEVIDEENITSTKESDNPDSR